MVAQPAPSYCIAHRATSGTIPRAVATALTTRDAKRLHAQPDEHECEHNDRSHRPIERREQETTAAASSRLAPRARAATARAITHG
jgi:hypothetical protein